MPQSVSCHFIAKRAVAFLSRRLFTSTSYLLLPQPNDQDSLFEKVDTLEKRFDEIDDYIETFTRDIEYRDLYKYLDKRGAEKDALLAKYEEARCRLLDKGGSPREDKSLALNMIQESTRKDIETIEHVVSKIPYQDRYEHIRTDLILRKLKVQDSNVGQLVRDFHDNDLPPMRSEETENRPSFPQDSSGVHQTEYNSFDPFG